MSKNCILFFFSMGITIIQWKRCSVRAVELSFIHPHRRTGVDLTDVTKTHLVAISGQVMLGEAHASGLHGAHSYSLNSRPETAPKTLRHPPAQPIVPPIPKPLPAPLDVLALLPAPSSLLSLLARPFWKNASKKNSLKICIYIKMKK